MITAPWLRCWVELWVQAAFWALRALQPSGLAASPEKRKRERCDSLIQEVRLP